MSGTTGIGSEGSALQAGRAAFNRGAFFEAHEHWEEVWRRVEGPGRLALQGLIQIAAGLHHLDQGRARPALRLLGKGLEKLRRVAPVAIGDLRLEALISEVPRLLADPEVWRTCTRAPFEI